jgi:biopolymer transport protein ExbD
MSRVRIRRNVQLAPELEITAFLNLMVILVPFLLITAAFSHMSILELNLPPENQAKPEPEKQDVNFELIIRQNSIAVADTLGGVIKQFNKDASGGYEMSSITELLVKIKEKFPDKLNITLLLEPNVPYEILVQTMDAVRLVTKLEGDEHVKYELFPLISIGDAPAPEPEVQSDKQG